MSDKQEELTSQIAYLYTIFAAPLVATVEADVLAATKFVEFIKKYGFEKKSADEGEKEGAADEDDAANVSFGKLRMVTFTYDRKEIVNGEIKIIKTKVQIPLLSLFPLPLLQVADANFKFDVHILSFDATVSQAPSLEDGGSESANGDNGFFKEKPFEVLASLTPMESETQKSKIAPSLYANMKVEINMRQADLPAGISQLLNVMSEGSSSQEKLEK